MHINQTIIFATLISFSTILFLWNIFQQFSLHKIKQRQKILFQGKNSKNLETIIINQQNSLQTLNKQTSELYKITKKLNNLANIGLNKVGMIRYNPFKNLGGNQSFSIAFLNSHHNGLVISSIYTNDSSRFYAKTILNGKSLKQFPLTKEENKAIDLALNKK